MVFLVVTVLADVAGVVLLGKAQGMERPGFLVAGIAALVLGFVLFSYATRTSRPAWPRPTVVVV